MAYLYAQRAIFCYNEYVHKNTLVNELHKKRTSSVKSTERYQQIIWLCWWRKRPNSIHLVKNIWKGLCYIRERYWGWVMIGTAPTMRMYESIHLGHTFWIDDDGLFMSCPTFKDGSVDMENAVSVYDWENWEEAHPHLPHLMHVNQICILKRDSDKIDYYSKLFAQ